MKQEDYPPPKATCCLLHVRVVLQGFCLTKPEACHLCPKFSMAFTTTLSNSQCMFENTACPHIVHASRSPQRQRRCIKHG